MEYNLILFPKKEKIHLYLLYCLSLFSDLAAMSLSAKGSEEAAAGSSSSVEGKKKKKMEKKIPKKEKKTLCVSYNFLLITFSIFFFKKLFW